KHDEINHAAHQTPQALTVAPDDLLVQARLDGVLVHVGPSSLQAKTGPDDENWLMSDGTKVEPGIIGSLPNVPVGTAFDGITGIASTGADAAVLPRAGDDLDLAG